MTRVLIAEDSATQAEALRIILEDHGCEVEVARNGRLALERARRGGIDVIVSDVIMPELSGHGLCRGIKADPALARTPVVLLTSLDEPTEVAEALACGADWFVKKPVQPDRLVALVESAARTSGEPDDAEEPTFTLFGKRVTLKRNRTRELRLLSSVLEELVSLNGELEVEKERLRSTNQALSIAQERAERESQYKSKFLAGMSHELRTPLNAIIGFSELLEQEIAGPLTQRQHQFVTNVHQSGRHLLTLVNDILDLSKIAAGRMGLHCDWTAPFPVIEAVQHVVQPLADKGGVTLSVDAEDGLPEVFVDPTRIRQILFNLLSNGIKFTPKGGAVTLRARNLGEELVLAVIDTGIGIAEADLPRLFREFEQIENDPGDKPEGTGLGLALTRRLVEMQGGRITVESELGRGSAFTVRFPTTNIGQSRQEELAQ